MTAAEPRFPDLRAGGARVTSVLVESSRFGTFEVHDDRVLRIDAGLLGIPGSTGYAVVETGDEDSPYVWLQSVEEPDVAFLATTPWQFFPDYELVVGDEDLDSLALQRTEDAEVFLLLTIHRDGDEVSDITANLLGPVVVNTATRRGRQLVLDRTSYTTRASLVG
jgi:flagellar assembly factor FliW